MVVFFKKGKHCVYAVETQKALTDGAKERLSWLLDGAKPLAGRKLKGRYIGPRREMVTPWSTNAVEIAGNMGLDGITRIEQFNLTEDADPAFDKMLSRLYDGLDSHVFDIDIKPAGIVYIDDIHDYNLKEGLALSPEEEDYLRGLQQRLGRPLTDSEVFGFSQVNSEHCRHKIFNGTFIIDGEEKPSSLFKLIKRTSQTNPNTLVSAYKDNVAFVRGPHIRQFAPLRPDAPSLFAEKEIKTVLSLKAETHNFPTTVEPFNGAATGTGGEIRDRLGGGRASLPLAGTAVYMTSYPRLDGSIKPWELMTNPRVWLYQTPADILIKASNGASDFGNKFGQPLICGSLLTFEHDENGQLFAYDKVIMLAGGVGFASASDAIKGTPVADEKVVVMGGDNYRIGMGGGAVSSVETGQYAGAIELNAVQRANPEMQKRVANVIRALAEADRNPIVSIHDHGAGGHLNALSELVEETGGHIDLDALPIGDNTLSAKEIIGNESQERMGMVVKDGDIEYIRSIARRERAPFYVVGHTTDDRRLTFEQADGKRPIDLEVADMIGNSPKTVIEDSTVAARHEPLTTDSAKIGEYVEAVLSLESVACKDWLTNKADRSVTGKVARQQCQGRIQLPLSDCGVVALDYQGLSGIATSIGHAPGVALVSPEAGSVMSVAEALTNIVGAELKKGLDSVSLSANWMWPCKNPGQDAALYSAVQACSDFVCKLGINIPTGKDSLSMTQKYGDKKVLAPGTVIISAAGEVSHVRRTVSPVLVNKEDTTLYYIDFSGCGLRLGGSALAQTMGKTGDEVPTVTDAAGFRTAFDTVQRLVRNRQLLAMHDVSAGGLVTTLLEMLFANPEGGLKVYTDGFAMHGETDPVKILFSENPAVVIQVDNRSKEAVERVLDDSGVKYFPIGHPAGERVLMFTHQEAEYLFGVDYLRDVWYKPSYELDRLQSGHECAAMRFDNYKRQPLRYAFRPQFTGRLSDYAGARYAGAEDVNDRPVAAIIREKGVNSDREMAYSLYLAGFDVRDVHMTDLTSGAETLDDVSMIVFCGGFSNSDVLGSAKGWAGGFVWNEKASAALRRFYDRDDTLSLGVCNGCQLMIALNLINPEHSRPAKMEHNISHKFESNFVSVVIPKNDTVMFGSLSGTSMGVWVAHGEGRFVLPEGLKNYNVIARYAYSAFPGNPNGSTGAVAGIASADGRHVAIMPHPERTMFPWQCAWYPRTRRNQDVTPWFEAMVNARRWVDAHRKK